jgi:hypothetical protein
MPAGNDDQRNQSKNKRRPFRVAALAAPAEMLPIKNDLSICNSQNLVLKITVCIELKRGNRLNPTVRPTCQQHPGRNKLLVVSTRSKGRKPLEGDGGS